MHVISGCIVQTYLYPWFQPQMLCSKLLPACHETLKGRNCTREDGGGLTRYELLYMVRNLIRQLACIPGCLIKFVPLE